MRSSIPCMLFDRENDFVQPYDSTTVAWQSVRRGSAIRKQVWLCPDTNEYIVGEVRRGESGGRRLVA